MSLIPIKFYRDFWDFPRIFLVDYNDSLILFDCKLNEETEEYEDKFQIFLMPKLTEQELNGSWNLFSGKAIKFLGEISINAISFDESKREFIEDDVFAK